jgi:putative heme-binding domain-containing protein
LQVLDPKRAADNLLARLESSELDERAAGALLQSAVGIASPEAGWGLLRLAENSARSADLRRTALEKVVANADGRGPWAAMAGEPQFAAALARLLDDAPLRPAALAAIDALRIEALGADVLELAQRGELAAADRQAAVDVVARLKPPGAAAALRKLAGDPQPDVARAALGGLVDLQDVRSLREVFSGGPFSLEARRAAAERALDTTSGAILLLRLIDEQILSAELQDAVLAKATKHPDANVRVLYERFIPAEQRARKLGSAVSADEILALAGDANRGRLIFYKSAAAQCQQCHAVQGFGGSSGPELTHIGKKYERRALLETILDPSRAIAPEYAAYVLETKSGRVYAGFLVERGDDAVVLRDVKNETVRVAADDVEALLRQDKSLMPELILSEVTAQDAADLLAFLTALE